MPDELKPCPFCGSRNTHLHSFGKWVFCEDCGTEGPSTQPVIAAWNRRAESHVIETLAVTKDISCLDAADILVTEFVRDMRLWPDRETTSELVRRIATLLAMQRSALKQEADQISEEVRELVREAKYALMEIVAFYRAYKTSNDGSELHFALKPFEGVE